jgi:hypothetical protein
MCLQNAHQSSALALAVPQAVHAEALGCLALGGLALGGSRWRLHVKSSPTWALRVRQRHPAGTHRPPLAETLRLLSHTKAAVFAAGQGRRAEARLLQCSLQVSPAGWAPLSLPSVWAVKVVLTTGPVVVEKAAPK